MNNSSSETTSFSWQNIFIHPESSREVVIHCGLHSFVSFVPSFCIALDSGFATISGIVGMVLGYFAFLFCAILLHLYGPIVWVFTNKATQPLVAFVKSVRFLQAAVLCMGFILSVLYPVISSNEHRVMAPNFGRGIFDFLMFPDLMAGFLALAATSQLAVVMNPKVNSDILKADSLPATLSATFIEGWILVIFMGIFFLALFLARSLYRVIAARN